MNQQEYQKWKDDAQAALLRIYTPEETEKVMDWFRHIKGQEERDLIGNDTVEAMLVFVTCRGRLDGTRDFNSADTYNSLMARLFVYAPIILKGA